MPVLATEAGGRARPPRRLDRWGLAVDLGGAIAFSLWTALGYLRADRLVISFDTIAYSGPNAAFTASELRAGRLPMWNDTIFGGAPHLANIHAGALYPFRAVFSFLDPVRSVNCAAALHVVLLAVGLVVLVRWRLGLRCPAALVASVGVLGSGMLAVRSLQLEQLIGLAWLPWLLAALDWALADERRSGWSIVAVAGPTAMLVMGGHAQTTYAGAVVAVVWVLARAVDLSAYGRLGRPIGGALLGGLLTAPQLLATAALAGRAGAVGERSLEDVGNPGFVLLAKRLVVAVLGDGTARNQASVAGNGESATSVGVAICVLALLAVVVALLERRARWTQLALGAAATGSLLLALGPRTPVYRVAFDVVPGLDSARVPGRWRDVTVVAACLLAAFAVDHLVRRAVPKRAALLGAGVLAVTVVAIVVAPFDLPSTRTVVLWLAAAAAVGAATAVTVAGIGVARAAAGVVAVVVVAEAGFLGPPAVWSANFPDQVDDIENAATQYVVDEGDRMFALTGELLGDPEYVTNGFRPNANALAGARSIDGYDGGVQVTDEWVDAVSALTVTPFVPDLMIRHQVRLPLDAELWARFGVRYVLYDLTMPLPIDDVFDGWDGPVVEDGQFAVFENTAFDGEAHLFGATLEVGDDEVSGEVLADDPRASSAALVEPGGPALSCRSCRPEPAEIARPRPGAIDAEVSSDADALLVVAEQWDEGWEATIDGRSTPVVRADGMFLGIEVPAGTHEVSLRYTAPGLRAGAALAALAAAIGFVLVCGPVRSWLAARLPRRGQLRDSR